MHGGVNLIMVKQYRDIESIAQDKSTYFYLVSLDVPIDNNGNSTTVHMTNAYRDIAVNLLGSGYPDTVFLRLGHLLSIGKITEDLNVNTSGTTITLAGADQTFISSYLSYPGFSHKVTIRIGRIYSADSSLHDITIIFSGFIDSYSISEDSSSGTSTLSLKATNQFSVFNRQSGRRLNDDDQQSIYPGDRGLMYTGELIDDLKWGESDV
jgi:hypothetical protein